MSYTKFHDPWETIHYLSAGAFNRLESQWTEIKEDADDHNHDTNHYTKTECDTKFFTTTMYTGFDADMLDGVHYTDIINDILPVKSILLWSGDEENVPDGWAICNGQTVGAITTPDLRGKFIIGAGSTYNIGDTGGATSTSVTASFTVLAHSLSNDEMPLHVHPYKDYTNVLAYCYNSGYPEVGASGSASTSYRTSGATGSGTGHTHTGNSITFSDITYFPYYYSLNYIMKVV